MEIDLNYSIIDDYDEEYKLYYYAFQYQISSIKNCSLNNNILKINEDVEISNISQILLNTSIKEIDEITMSPVIFENFRDSSNCFPNQYPINNLYDLLIEVMLNCNIENFIEVDDRIVYVRYDKKEKLIYYV